jgi:hypothetical protein
LENKDEVSKDRGLTDSTKGFPVCGGGLQPNLLRLSFNLDLSQVATTATCGEQNKNNVNKNTLADVRGV